MKDIITTLDADETRQWGQALAKRLSPGDIVALIGDLGAGKTVLTQGILKGVGIQEPVSSPSFIMAREYQTPTPAVHIDLYRLNNTNDFLALGFDEYLNGQWIAVIEWAEKIADILPQKHHQINLSWGDDPNCQRHITYKNLGNA